MKVQPVEITVRELVENYEDNEELGVRAYNGMVDVRPPYQREFIYNDKQRNAVINTLFKGFPLNVMYWAVRDDGTYEVIDGQQRTISICQYVEGDFAHNYKYFCNLQEDEKSQILNYSLMIYLCSGTDSEKLEWFKTVNIAGAELTDQELRNAVYSGTWVTDSKKYFSKTGCAAYELGGKYMKGTPIRQDYLETVIKWINGGKIEDYMAKMQHTSNAGQLWRYFQDVITWTKVIFPKYRKEMKGVAWGELCNLYKDIELDAVKLENEISILMADENVTKKSGIYMYVLSGDESKLNIRAFDDRQKREAYERQNGICPTCDKPFELEKMQADHIIPWSKGGKTDTDNCQMLCAGDNRRKSNG